MKRVLNILKRFVIVLLLTATTQVGGLVYLLWLSLQRFLPQGHYKLQRSLIKGGSFVILYLLFTLAIIPPLASAFGRVPLSITKHGAIRPARSYTWILNRHYVNREMLELLSSVATNERFEPGYILYLDACFPFIDGFPLLPHLSHKDGKKVDLAFFYKDQEGKPLHNFSPSLIGYGVFADGNANPTADRCKEAGYWQYNILGKLMSPFPNASAELDTQNTRRLLELLNQSSTTSKIFIEPYLKSRLLPQGNKIRFHGCHSVRHDDHIHLEIH
ncbi:MAG: hypothetical protein MK081_03290 [Flavobacteriales bacterium]|nr:hypothetical protein [Flavobacteriales bacterium]